MNPFRLRHLSRLVLVAVALASVGASPARRPPRGAPTEAPNGYGRLVIITDFDETEVQIGRVSYPYEYIYANQQGVLLPAEVTFQLIVSTSPEKRRTFTLRLERGETRVLVVDMTNMGAVAGAPPRQQAPENPGADAKPSEGSGKDTSVNGYLGVASTPPGTVVIDGAPTEHHTPARRIELPPGQHQVSVNFDGGGTADTKTVLIRSAINTSVYFRPNADLAPGAP